MWVPFTKMSAAVRNSDPSTNTATSNPQGETNNLKKCLAVDKSSGMPDFRNFWGRTAVSN